MHTCATCIYWTQGRDREMVGNQVVAPAYGHCAIHMCMCRKAENQDCCHGFHDWKANPASRAIMVHCVTELPCLMMPWQPGYEEWAKAHPELAKPSEPIIEETDLLIATETVGDFCRVNVLHLPSGTRSIAEGKGGANIKIAAMANLKKALRCHIDSYTEVLDKAS